MREMIVLMDGKVKCFYKLGLTVPQVGPLINSPTTFFSRSAFNCTIRTIECVEVGIALWPNHKNQASFRGLFFIKLGNHLRVTSAGLSVVDFG